ncbi:hypothetical protein C0993_011376 [Termitomyces sp. T159_Od127]|nr:hypothetical protein C0993_011376 [Termitomyces sp. T159_Od127]
MSTTVRRKGKAKYEKDDLLDPPAKIVKAVRRRGSLLRLVQGRGPVFSGVQSNAKSHFRKRNAWVLLVSVLAVFTVLLYYDSIRGIFRQNPGTWQENEATQMTYEQWAEDARNGTDAFKIVDIPGKGKGMIAIRDIEQGERILKEKPAFVVPSQTSESPSAIIASFLREASSHDREAFLDLSYVNFPEDLDPEIYIDEVVLAIFQTNAIAAGTGVGIFPKTARMNHGCSSAFNAVYTWRDREEVLVVHALKKIFEGEEILTAYTNTKKPRAERSESRASDTRLMDISHAYARFANWGQGTISGMEAIDIVKLIWSIEDEEGYWSERGQLAADAAWVAAAHSDAAATIEWAKLAIEWYGYELGYDSEQVQDLTRTAIDPRSHREWGSRETQRIGGPGRR